MSISNASVISETAFSYVDLITWLLPPPPPEWGVRCYPTLGLRGWGGDEAGNQQPNHLTLLAHEFLQRLYTCHVSLHGLFEAQIAHIAPARFSDIMYICYISIILIAMIQYYYRCR